MPRRIRLLLPALLVLLAGACAGSTPTQPGSDAPRQTEAAPGTGGGVVPPDSAARGPYIGSSGN